MATPKAETIIETVTMEDGRIVDFPGKRKILKDSFIAEDGTVTLRMDFRNGSTRTYTMPPALLAKFAAHGMEQKYGDETAGVEALEDAVAAVDALHAHLEKGEWSRERASSGSFSGMSVAIAALMEYRSIPQERALAYVESKVISAEEAKATGKAPVTRQAVLASLRRLDSLRPIIERIEAERAAKRVGGAAPIVDESELDSL